MMKAAKLEWVGPGAQQEQGRSKLRAGGGLEQGRSRAERGQELGGCAARVRQKGRKRSLERAEVGADWKPNVGHLHHFCKNDQSTFYTRPFKF